jgi:ATP-binding cassette, subfamily A (ABC1), member 3
VLLPIAFAGILVGIKNVIDTGDPIESLVVDPQLRSDDDVMVPLSFSDYVTALLADRVCIERGGFGDDIEYDISGMPYEGKEWQVPFMRCDERECTATGQEAYDFCEYYTLAVAPMTAGDTGGKERAENFKTYVEERWPLLTDPSKNHFDGYDFVKMFESNAAIDKYVTSPNYGFKGFEKIGLAVVFDGNDPLDFKYSIRQNATNYNTWAAASQPAAPSTPSTKKLFSTYRVRDDACNDLFVYESPEGNSCTARYIYNGLLTTQRLVQDFMMVDTGAKDEGYFVSEHGVRFVPFPVRSYTEEGIYADLSDLMPLLLTLGILYTCATMISYVVQEKELRQKELLKMMGVTDMEIGLSWFFTFWMLHIITATLITLVSSKIFPASEFVLMFIFWQFCFLGFICLCLLLSTLTAKTTRSVLIGILAVFGGFFLTLAADFETGSAGTISLISLHPVAAMVYGILEIGRLEGSGAGLTSNSMTTTDSPSGFTFASALVNLIFSCIVMGILTWYLNRVIAPDYGQALPAYFPFTKTYWFPSTIKHGEAGSSNDDMDDEGIPIEQVTDNLKKQSKDGQNIEIKNLRKDFGEKIAVDGLNLSMYSGQITALLGHNGGRPRLCALRCRIRRVFHRS